MAGISAQTVNEFRKRTGLGLMECKALLQQADGDLARAEKLAKEKGVLKAAGRSGRSTNAGRVEVAFNPDATLGAIIELNCETDFVARNDEFRQAARELAEQVLANGPDDLLDQPCLSNPSQTVKDALTVLNSRTGENIHLARAARIGGGGRIDAYVHHDGKSAALVETAGEGLDPAALAATARDVALQIVATKPLAVGRDDVDAKLVDEQRQIFQAQVDNQMADKPENIREKIATGKLDAWFKENTLLEQEFVKDPAKKVRDVIAELGKQAAVKRFVCFVVGDSSEPAAE